MADFTSFSLSIDHGSTARLDFAVTTNGVAQDITGWVLWFSAKRRLSDSDATAVIQHSTHDGAVTVTSPSGGLGTVTLSPADTSALPEAGATLFADLKGIDGSGNQWELAKGKLIIDGVVTQATS